MNIFVLDSSPPCAVQMLCDFHVRKMCIKTAQILSGVMLQRGMTLLDGMPEPQDINHPVIKAVDTQPKVNWLCFYFESILKEYSFRFEAQHKYTGICNLYYNALHDKVMFAPIRPIGNNIFYTVLGCRNYYIKDRKPTLQAKGLWNFTNREDWTI